jgi:pimeloyl-ACP methyl ester carboxylesterase
MLRCRHEEPNGYSKFVDDLFRDLFTAKSDATMVTSVVGRAGRLPRSIGEKLLMDMLHYNVDCLARASAKLHLPVMAVQTTYSNEKHQRVTMTQGQTTPYLSVLHANIPSARMEIIPNTGHFPQLEESAQTNALIDGFIRTLS